MSEDSLFAVLLRKDVRLDVPAVAGPVAEALHVNIFDARRIVRYARGIVADQLDRPTAESLSAALARIGVDTVIAAESEFAVLIHPRRVVIADCGESALKVKSDFRREYEVIPWERVEFVSAGIIATAQYRDYLSSKSFKLLPAIHKIADDDAKKELREKLAHKALERRKVPGLTEIRSKSKLANEDLESLKSEQTDGFLDLLIAPTREHLRISRHDFRFDYLGTRARPRSLDNFKLLVRDAVAHARATLATSITQALLDGMEIHEIVFDTPKEFDKYNTWFLYMGQASAEALRSAAPAPAPVVSAAAPMAAAPAAVAAAPDPAAPPSPDLPPAPAAPSGQ